MATDADAQAYIDEVESISGGTYSGAYDTAIDELVQDLKTAGIWSKLDRMFLFWNEIEEGATVDLKAPTVSSKAVPDAGISWVADQGYSGDGSSLVDLIFNPSTDGVNYTLNSASWAVKISASPGSGNHGIGNTLIREITGGTNAKINTSNESTSNVETGFFHIDRPGSANQTFYVDGSQVDTDPEASGSLESNSMAVLGENRFGGRNYSTATVEFAVLGASLGAEAADLDQAIDDYLTATQAGGGTNFDGSVSIGHTLGLSPSASAAVTGGVTNAQTMGMSDQGGATTLASLEQAISLALQTSGAISFEGNITINVSYGQGSSATAQTSAELSGAENVTLFHSYAMSTSAQSSAAGATTIDLSYGQSATGAVGINNFDASVALGDITYQTSITGTAQTVASFTQSIQYALDSIAAAAVSSNTSIAYINDISASATVITVDVTLADGRTLTIKMQNRTLSIDSENRTLTIDP